jgi:hypothetical protein
MRRPRRARGQLVAAVVTGLLGLTVAGCGSGGQPSPGPTAAATAVAAPAPSDVASGTTPPAVPVPATPRPGRVQLPRQREDSGVVGQRAEECPGQRPPG